MEESKNKPVSKGRFDVIDQIRGVAHHIIHTDRLKTETLDKDEVLSKRERFCQALRQSKRKEIISKKKEMIEQKSFTR